MLLVKVDDFLIKYANQKYPDETFTWNDSRAETIETQASPAMWCHDSVLQPALALGLVNLAQFGGNAKS